MKGKITLSNVLTCMGVLVLGMLLSCTGREKRTAEQAEVKAEAETALQAEAKQPDQWISLFDGETLDGWKRYNADEIGPLWSVEDGAILCDGKGRALAERGKGRGV
jgi:hypothetical protein